VRAVTVSRPVLGDQGLKFFYADSQDLVDPNFNFELETRDPSRIRQRDDHYAHELFTTPCYDGLLVSKGIVDGIGVGSRYTLAQRHRLYRLGVHEYFRAQHLPVMGDCGAFTYVNEETPPFSVDEVIRYYVDCDFDMAVSVDHVILAYQPEWDTTGIPKEVQYRQEITLELAAQFLDRHRTSKLRFEPLGVAQGWSPASYARAVEALQRMGYSYIAIGGMVPLKTTAIIACLAAINEVREPATRLHLLGVTRCEHINEFARYGVASFDSTSPLRQAFKDDKDNYYSPSNLNYTAIRIPQIEANARLMKSIRSGVVPQEWARKLEQECLAAMRAYAQRGCSLDATLNVLLEYERVYDGRKNHEAAYRATLTDRPWEACECDVCHDLGYHVILFRGAERNRRRGFHNLWIFYRRVHRELAKELRLASTAS
jgi:hypothetical protein